MIRVTRWSPDTCNCVFEYEWDDAQKEDVRIHTFKDAIQLCEHHKILPGIEAYDGVMAENTTKNITLGIALKAKPDLTIDEYTWSFDANRKLKVGFLGKLSTGERSTLQSMCDSKFGAGKVEVV